MAEDSSRSILHLTQHLADPPSSAGLSLLCE